MYKSLQSSRLVLGFSDVHFDPCADPCIPKLQAHADCEYEEIKGAVRPPHQQRADSAATSDAHPADTSEGPSYATVHFRRHPEQQADAKATAESLQEDDAGCEYAAIKHRC